MSGPTSHLSIWQAVGWSFFVYPLWAFAAVEAVLLLTDRGPERDMAAAFFLTTLAAPLTFVAVLWTLTLCGIEGMLL